MAKQEVQKSTGRFPKGKSGNPKGRPKGSKNKVSLIREGIEGQLVEASEKDALDIYKKTVAMAKAGDTTCIKILMDRMWPAGRPDDRAEKSGGGINIIIKGLEIEDPKVIEGEVVKDG